MYTVPEGEEWRRGLLEYLLELREENWDVLFNEEDEEEENLEPNDIEAMIFEVCTI